MKELIYQVKFLSDVVLPATSNTEGNIEQLDFIAGSNFLGMVAKNYSKFENSFEMFHSGTVKFGDAHIVCDGKLTYKMPLSYFHEKLDDKTLLNHHLIDDIEKYKQLKQKRKGYITKDNDITYIEYNYLQKSSYDKEKRRSKDSTMFGYSAIKSGTIWQFSVSYDESISSSDLELLKQSIVGKQRLGKSKSAQYGLVEIIQKGSAEDIEDKNSNELILYLNSRVALFDNEGNPTYDLKYLFDGLSDDNIVYEKCQIKTSTFTPYNGARQTKDYERVCINKGSVIVLQNIDKKDIAQFVGAYQSEGFGEIVLNPKFLLQNELSYTTKIEQKREEYNIKRIETHFQQKTVQFLVNRHNKRIETLEVVNIVSQFIKDNFKYTKEKMNSQWGQIRSLSTQAKSKQDLYDLLFLLEPNDKSKGFLRGNRIKEKWNINLIENLENSYKFCEREKIDFIKFIKLLSIQMPKAQNKGVNND